ncbi:PaaI family thioesterase [Nocardia sp. SYP-A9097]|uniref:PaaI family thioesterase n=1 Tax=Nocardia sp. SYP-A9097 TaxID=2663237 RepID=UPI0013212030|nr:PaaI family thioesterase [Nocardia sp. SYP-A9097]MRH88329.1 PaaI family thioesterase [Nocardia sp. SYP-A9097]
MEPTAQQADPPAVAVPWSVIPDYHCFGCSPHNESGLRLSFTPDGDGLAARFCLGRSFESYPGVVHGGLIGVICDEVMGNLIVLARHVPAFTVSQRTRFLTPLLIDREYRCVATLSGDGTEQPIRASADILDADGAVCATSAATYQPFTLADARHHLSLGDDEVALLSHALTTADALPPNGVRS